MIRCLGSTYTSNFLNFASIDACLLAFSDNPVYPGEPMDNFPALWHLLHHHIPFKASLRIYRKYMLFIKRHNNHHDSDPIPILHSREVGHQYLGVLLHWSSPLETPLFQKTFHLCPRLRHTQEQGKGQRAQVNDISALLLVPNESGALEFHIHREDPVTIPQMHYQYAHQHLWNRIYIICINHPDEDIIIYRDDLVSSFCRILYHPDVASSYDFFLSTYLVIPVGMIFGSRDATSLFYLLSDMRSFASKFVHHLPLSCPTTLMINRVRFPPAPTSSRDINPDHRDRMNQGVDGTNMGPQTTFGNDTIMAEVRSIIC